MDKKQEIDAEIQGAINAYLKARSALRALGEKHPKRMGGNDNLIGRIGEFMALRFFEEQGRKPKKVRGGNHSTNPGFDLVEGGALIQVKVITHENKLGRSSRLRAPWTELLLIELGSDYKHSRIGHLRAKDHAVARKKDKRLSKFPIVRRSMLEDNGLIGLYGEVTLADDPPPDTTDHGIGSYERVRLSFKPAETRLLFVGESRPYGGTFFYNGDSHLARHTQNSFEAAFKRSYKSPAAFLAAFKNAGCWLVDLCVEPVNGLKDKPRREICNAGEPALAHILSELRPRTVIGVKVDLERHIRRAIARAGIGALDLHMLPFPLYQHAARYESELVRILGSLPDYA